MQSQSSRSWTCINPPQLLLLAARSRNCFHSGSLCFSRVVELGAAIREVEPLVVLLQLSSPMTISEPFSFDLQLRACATPAIAEQSGKIPPQVGRWWPYPGKAENQASGVDKCRFRSIDRSSSILCG